MQEIIIGIQGNQPFKITANGVSSKHAKLTITDDGRWILEDLNSTNGTYIYNGEQHSYVRISKKEITPDTSIRLGNNETLLCYEFKARLCVEDEDEYFRIEFKKLMQKWEETQQRKVKIEKKIALVSWIPIGISWILALMRFSDLPIEQRLNLMCVGMLITPFLSRIVSTVSMKWLKTFNAEVKETFVCPNPKCGMPLTETELKRGQCLKCKKHI